MLTFLNKGPECSSKREKVIVLIARFCNMKSGVGELCLSSNSAKTHTIQ